MPPRSGTRLTDTPEFDRVYRQGVAYRGSLFAVHAFPNGSDLPRLGLSVSRKVGNAVVRNRVRRRLREVFHGALSEVPGSLDIVVSARGPSAEASFEDFDREFAKALRKFDAKFSEPEGGNGGTRV